MDLFSLAPMQVVGLAMRRGRDKPRTAAETANPWLWSFHQRNFDLGLLDMLVKLDEEAATKIVPKPPSARTDQTDSIELPPLKDHWDPDLDVLQYESLSSPSSIRLLQVHAKSELLDLKMGDELFLYASAFPYLQPYLDTFLQEASQSIFCSMESVDLDLGLNGEGDGEGEGEGDVPDFVVLSYESLKGGDGGGGVGFPDTTLEGKEEDSTGLGTGPCFPIICDGKTVLISRPLSEALLQLRSELDGEGMWNVGSNGAKTRYIWIRDICINPNDEEEERNQKKMMEKIHKSAMDVFMWIGLSDSSTSTALNVLQVLALLNGKGKEQMWKSAAEYLLNSPEPYQILGIRRISIEEWITLRALLSRVESSCIQEICLARGVRVFCGSSPFGWGYIVLAYKILVSLGWVEALTLLPDPSPMLKRRPLNLQAFARLIAIVERGSFSK